MKVLLIGVWLLYFGATSVTSQIVEIETNGICFGSFPDYLGVPYDPIVPTEQDSISIVINGNFPDPGFYFAQRSIISVDDTIFINLDIDDVGGIQPDILVPWGIRACLPPRPVGEHTISVVIDRETLGGNSNRFERDYPMNVVPEQHEGLINIAWLTQNTFPKVLNNTEIGTLFTVVILPGEEWTGELTQLWISLNPSGLHINEETASFTAACDGRMQVADADHMTLYIQCSEWNDREPLFSFNVTATEEYAGWADVRLDSIKVLNNVMVPNQVIRITELPIGDFLIMDFNLDNKVDMQDFYIFAEGFDGANSFFDFDGDKRVDFDDFFLLVSQFGKTIQAP